MSLQACSSSAHKDVAVLDEGCLHVRASSLTHLVLIFVSGVDVAFNIHYPSGVDLHWCVVFYLYLCLRLVNLHSSIFTFTR